MWSASQRLHLFKVLIELSVSLIDVSFVSGGISGELLLYFSDEIYKSGNFSPLEERFVIDFTSHGEDEGVFDPFGDVDDWFFLREVAQKDAVWLYGYILIG